MEPGQEDQWRDALARMHQGVQFLQLDRLVSRKFLNPVSWQPLSSCLRNAQPTHMS